MSLSHLLLDSLKLLQEKRAQEKVIEISSIYVIDIHDAKYTWAYSSTQIEGQLSSYKLEEIWEQCN